MQALHEVRTVQYMHDVTTACCYTNRCTQHIITVSGRRYCVSATVSCPAAMVIASKAKEQTVDGWCLGRFWNFQFCVHNNEIWKL